MTEKPYDVFISHSTQDAGAASAIKQHLQSAGLRCWKAPDDINPGESWPSAITRALSMCRVMVLVWSSNSLASREVSKELTIAMRNGLTVIPFRIEDIQPTSEWDYHLANTHWMDAFPGELQSYVEELAARIRGHLHAGNPSASLPADYPKRAGAQTSRSTASIRKGMTTGLLVALVLAFGGSAFWFLSMKSAGDSPSANDLPTANAAARELAALERSAQQAEMEKTKAQREAAEREADALREAAQRAEAEKQLALEKAARAEESARRAQDTRIPDFSNSRQGSTLLSPQPATMSSPPQATTAQVSENRTQPQAKVLNYYDLVNAGDYSGAWSLLPSALQNNKKIHPQGFSSFQTWMRQITPVTVTDIRVLEQTSEQAIVELSYDCVVSGKPRVFNLRYTLAWNPSQKDWEFLAVKSR